MPNHIGIPNLMEDMWLIRKSYLKDTKHTETHDKYLESRGAIKLVDMLETWCLKHGVYKNEQEMEEAEFSATRTQPNKEV
jgi:hypothetical protein